MLDQTYIASLKKSMLSYDQLRRSVIKESGDMQHLSKRAIFALHRNDYSEAKTKLAEATEGLKRLQKLAIKDKRVIAEGSYREAIEEYVEAVLFQQFLLKKKITKIAALAIEPESYIAGLCDVPGELYRYAIARATEHDTKEVLRALEAAQEMIGMLIECNLTKYLRSKFDQAKQAAGKIEIVVYELRLRNIA